MGASLLTLGGCRIQDVKLKEQSVKQKPSVLSTVQKGLQQTAQAAERKTPVSQEQSSERQAETQAGATVCETVSMTVYGVDRAGRTVTNTIHRGLESRREHKQGQKAGNRSGNKILQESNGANALSGSEMPEQITPVSRNQRTAMPENRGWELAKSREKERRLKSTLEKPAVKPQKTAARGNGNVSAPLGKAAQTASGSATKARTLAERGKQITRASAHGIKAIAQKLAAAVKKIGAAVQSLTAALAAGGTTAVIVVLFVCLIGMVAGSSFGLFFASQPTGNGVSLQNIVQQLNEEYYASISEIEQTTAHDRVEYLPDGLTAIRWEDVLSVFASDMAAADNGQPVAVLESAQIDRLKEILWLMNPVSYRTYTEDHEEEQTTIDEDGNEIIDTVTVTETILEITIQHHTSQDMASALGFTARQNEQLALLSTPQNQVLWMELLGGYVSGGGQIITPGAVPAGTSIFQWPLPDAYSITSHFGSREDPYSGETSSHTGTDISAPLGTPILAAAGGTVTIANATDPWGGSYGYYVKIDHGSGFETLYAHCSAICVTSGQSVQQGEVIGYVGSTGRSTGEHLHFEVWVNGMRTDAMGYFAR